MKWEIIIKPMNPALNVWTWNATRADQENVLYADQTYGNEAAARTSAQLAIQEYEDSVMVMKNATITEEFVPEGVDPE